MQAHSALEHLLRLLPRAAWISLWATLSCHVDVPDEGSSKLVCLVPTHDEGDDHPEERCVTTDLAKDEIQRLDCPLLADLIATHRVGQVVEI